MFKKTGIIGSCDRCGKKVDTSKLYLFVYDDIFDEFLCKDCTTPAQRKISNKNLKNLFAQYSGGKSNK